uniref:C2H2-type domain-containing protein n=1 Tax=Glossina brevipalpis TaxID=37001 RepID=A0A1A9WKA5_9MUSC
MLNKYDTKKDAEELDKDSDDSMDCLNNLRNVQEQSILTVDNDDLTLHAQIKEKQFVDNRKYVNNGQAELSCSICSFARIENNDSLLKHLNLHRDNYFFCMDLCGATFKYLRECLSHEMREHDKYYPKHLVPDAFFHCSFCRASFKSELQLHVHWLVSRQSCSELMQKVVQQVNNILAAQNKNQKNCSNTLTSVPITKLRLKFKPPSSQFDVNKKRTSLEEIPEYIETLSNKRSKIMENTELEIKKEQEQEQEELGEEQFAMPLSLVPEVIIKTEPEFKEEIKEEFDDLFDDELDDCKEKDEEIVKKPIDLQTTSSTIPTMHTDDSEGKVIPNTKKTVIKSLTNFKLIKLSSATALNENITRAQSLLSVQLKPNTNTNNNDNNNIISHPSVPLRIVPMPLNSVEIVSSTNAVNENITRQQPSLLKTNANNNNNTTSNPSNSLRLISLPTSGEQIVKPFPNMNENIIKIPSLLPMQLKTNANNNSASNPNNNFLRLVSIPSNGNGKQIVTPASGMNENIAKLSSSFPMQLKSKAYNNATSNPSSSSLRLISIPSSEMQIVTPPVTAMKENVTKIPSLLPLKLKSNDNVNNQYPGKSLRLVPIPLNRMQIVKLPNGTQVTKLEEPTQNTHLQLNKQSDMKTAPVLLTLHPITSIPTSLPTTIIATASAAAKPPPPPLVFNGNVLNKQIRLQMESLKKSTGIDMYDLKPLQVQTLNKVDGIRKNVVISKARLKAIESIPEKKKLIDHYIKQIERVEQKQTEQKSNEVNNLTTITDSNDDEVTTLPINANSPSSKVISDPPSVFISMLTTTDLELVEACRQYPDYHYKFVCPYCQKDYELKANLKWHLTHSHSLTHKDLCRIRVQAKPFQTTIFLRSLENHSEKIKSSKTDIVDFGSGNSLDVNKTSVETSELPNASLPLSSCSPTPDSTTRVVKIEPIKLAALNMNKTRYICDKCGRTCSSKSMLNDHIIANCGRVPSYHCPQCPKKFYSSGTLHCHMTIHTGELPHKCHYCDKRFRTKGQVTVHHRTHTGERPFVCEVCSLRFTHRETLIAHLSRHIGMKRYKCYGCSRLFLCISALKTHRNTRPDTCGKVRFNPRAVGPRVRVVRGNVIFEPQPEINPYLRSEDPKSVLAELQNHESSSSSPLSLQQD